MKVRKLDHNHDWTFGFGLSSYEKDREATKQSIKTILLSFKGDWFLDLDHGIDWGAYFVKNPNIRAMRSDIMRRVNFVYGVKEITLLDLYQDTVTRKIRISLNYIDIWGNENEVTLNA